MVYCMPSDILDGHLGGSFIGGVHRSDQRGSTLSFL